MLSQTAEDYCDSAKTTLIFTPSPDFRIVEKMVDTCKICIYFIFLKVKTRGKKRMWARGEECQFNTPAAG